MTTLTLVLLWVLPSILVSVLLGFVLGRMFGKHERKVTLNALMKMLESTETLSQEVDSHNHDLADVGQSVSDLPTSGEVANVQLSLLSKISEVIKSNQKLEDDLVCARYTLENQAQELDRTRREARTDSLSGVANRKDFDETLKYWLSKAKRDGKQFALLLVDVDHFKWINDTHGHAAGDKVVTGVGKFFRDRLRDSDYVARYGGDEFVVLMSNISLEAAARVSERIRQEGERSNFDCGSYGERIAVTFSLGLAMSLPDDSATTVLERADQALYMSKEGGRNQLNWIPETVAGSPVANEQPPATTPVNDAHVYQPTPSSQQVAASVASPATAAVTPAEQSKPVNPFETTPAS